MKTLLKAMKRQALALQEIYYRGRPDWNAFSDGTPPAGLAAAGPIETWFWTNEDRVVDKWVHYLPLYDQYLAKWRTRAPRFLEIGVQNGGSMAMWRDYFGPDATIFGIDVNPECARLDGVNGSVRIGSQDDKKFLRKVVEEMGGVDIVLDDGSHVQKHVVASFQALFPLLSEGGTYIVEDMHTAYWPVWGGGRRRKGTFIELAKVLVDDLHHWYADFPAEVRYAKDRVGGVHFHDSLVVIDKTTVAQPMRAVTGAGRLPGA